MSGWYHPALFRKVLFFEWILLTLCAGGELLAWRFLPPDPSTPSLLVSLVFLTIVAVLSFLAPVEGSYWDRLCFLFFELVLVTGATASGLARFVFPLYVVVIAKACLILDRKGIMIIGAAAFVSQIAWASFKLVVSYPPLGQSWWKWEGIFTLTLMSLLLTYGAIVLMVLVGMLTLALVAEQKSRMESERLSREVESLARELERTAIAREIHDGLGHTLTSLNIQLEVARKFDRVDATKARQALELAKDLAAQSLTDVRMAVQSMRNREFDLRGAVKALAERLQQAQSPAIELDLDACDVPAATGYQLFRIIQECLTNVLKHAGAENVKIAVKQEPAEIRMLVCDDGRGLSEEGGQEGFGIKGIKERVESMRGSVVIEAQPEKGTRIKVSIPL